MSEERAFTGSCLPGRVVLLWACCAAPAMLSLAPLEQAAPRHDRLGALPPYVPVQAAGKAPWNGWARLLYATCEGSRALGQRYDSI